jgi:protein O-GlcNAc transferase
MTSPPQSADPKSMMAAAMQHHNAGRLADADALYSAVLRIDANHVDALHLSGLIASQRGDKAQALTLIGKAIALKPDAPMFHNNLGNILAEIGQADEALTAFEAVLQLKPGFVPALYNLGNLHHRAGRLQQALECYRAALQADDQFLPARVGLGNVLLELMDVAGAEIQFTAALGADPEWSEACNGLGGVRLEQRRFPEAIALFRRALAEDPHNPQILVNLGNVQRAMDDFGGAAQSYHAAIAHAPESPHAYYALACIHLHQGRLQEAAGGLQRALSFDPAYAEAHYNLGNVYRLQGRTPQALESYDKAVRLKPDFIVAQWAYCMAQLPIIYDSREDLHACREKYRAELQSLSANLKLDTPARISAAAAAVGSIQPFYLAYQGMNDRDLQKTYGELVCRIQAAAFGAMAAKVQTARPARKRVRVGFVSGFFYHHSNWKMPLKGWIEQLDREHFELVGYYTGQPSRQDGATEEAKRALDKFHAETRFEEMLQIIAADQPDVLIYAELGMDPMTVRLAGLRLAPVQCSSWGHPETSGTPTIDYFLSSDLMEAPGAESHYSEKLVRLPNLSIHYTPLQHAGRVFARSEFGLRSDRVVYFCAQSLFKYLPQFDDVFPRIAREVPDCQFAFLDYPDSPWLTDIFRRRMEGAFAARGLNSADHVVIVRHLSQAEYHGLNTVADVFLDSVGWSGCNSTLEAIACDLPVATMAGEMMRGRHTLAFMRMMGLDELVAADVEGLIAAAVRLGRDPEARRGVSARISANKHRLYGDRECVRALEKFLLEKGRSR